MAAAALLAAGWAVQAAASRPVIPPAAPAMTATISSSSAATVARVMVAEPRSAAGDGIRERLLQELPAPAGSMSHTTQPEPPGVRVTAQPAEERLVPPLPVMTWATVTVTVTDPGVRPVIARPVTVATATWRAAVRWARTPRSPAAWAR